MKLEERTIVEKQEYAKYRLHGVILESNFGLLNEALVSGQTPTDVVFTRKRVVSFPIDPDASELIYSSPYQADAGETMCVYSKDEWIVIRFTYLAEFYISDNRIICYQLPKTPCRRIEYWLTGLVLSLVLEQRGVPMLHATSVRVDEQAVAFLGHSTAGKTSLAATFVQAGFSLLSDDPLAVHVRDGRALAEPGYPQMRLWGHQAEYFWRDYQHSPRLDTTMTKLSMDIAEDGWGCFHSSSSALAAIFIPARRVNEYRTDDDIHIEFLSLSDAMIELVRYSFLHRILVALGLHPKRLAKLAQIVKEVPVARIRYPNGLEYLPFVRDRILSKIESLDLPRHIG